MAKKLPKIISKDEVLQLLKGINRKCPTGCRNYAIFTFMYRGGFRNQEICNLTLSDVNFQNETVYVQQSKYLTDRYVPMDADMIQAAKDWLEMRQKGGIESNYFFCTLDGGQIDPRYIRQVCYRLAEKAGVYIQDGRELKLPHPHNFRHSYATSLLQDGFNPREVQELLGHKNLNTTMVYTHIAPKALAEKIKNRPSMTTQ